MLFYDNIYELVLRSKTFHFLKMATRLHIKICEAKNVLRMDVKGKSDPYITLRLKSQDKKDFQKTQIISNSTDPVWNEEFDLVASDANDMLLINMYDEDIKMDDKMMDELQFPVNTWIVGGPVNRKEIDLKLKKKNAGKLIFEVQAFPAGGYSSNQMNNNSGIQSRDISLGQEHGGRRGHLRIHAVGAKNLTKMDKIGKSDPYMTFGLKNQPSSEVRTQVISNNLNPVWNQDLTVNVPDIDNDTLLVNIYDEDLKRDCKMIDEQQIQLSKVPIGKRQIFNDSVTLNRQEGGQVHYEYILEEGPAAPQERDIKIAQPCKVIVHAMKAEKIRKTDAKTTDSYLTLQMKEEPESVKRTKSITNDLNPVWNQTFELHSKDWNNDTLVVNLLNKSARHNGDKLMNELELPIRQWPIGTHIDYQEDIRIKKKKTGRLYLGIDIIEEDEIPQEREVELTEASEPVQPETEVETETEQEPETETEQEQEPETETESFQPTETETETETEASVQSRDVNLEEPSNEYCDFTWGEYGSEYSTNFAGYTENSSSMSKMHSYENYHRHHRLHKDSEPQNAN